jgi:deoxyribodipyrimidine photo-lyase
LAGGVLIDLVASVFCEWFVDVVKMNKQKTVLVWFRRDLRLADNPALFEAAQVGRVIPLFIWDDLASSSIGAASQWWLHHSLNQLNASLEGNLWLRKGNPLAVLEEIIKDMQVDLVCWNRLYEPHEIKRDKYIKEYLKKKGCEVKSFNGGLLWEPWDVIKADGRPYQVFTPFYQKGCLSAALPRHPLPEPTDMVIEKDKNISPYSAKMGQLNLLPKIPWDESLARTWHIGESAAMVACEHFIEEGLSGYQVGRDFPAKANVSRLSPHLHFGEISPNQLWYAVKAAASVKPLPEADVACLLKELGWREFSYHLLFHFPELPTKNWRSGFDRFPWQTNPQYLKAWQRGQTGIPMVDAGMRELWQTGYMHNRVRMITASFLVKHLLIDWREGTAWFWDCLVDADLASNSASWQWVAGCGADAAPYFRVFNPVLQTEKFDPDGSYIRRYVPELAKLSNAYIARPWEAPAALLQQAGVVLGQTYPKPIVDLNEGRLRALAAFEMIKN